MNGKVGRLPHFLKPAKRRNSQLRMSASVTGTRWQCAAGQALLKKKATRRDVALAAGHLNPRGKAAK